MDFPPRHFSDSTKWMRFGDGVIPAWIADMDCASSDAICKALQKRATHGVYGYARPTPQLWETVLSYFHRRWGWAIQKEWIIPMPGLGAAIHTACRLAGGDILTPCPIYHVFRKAPAIAACRRADANMILQNGDWKLPTATLENARTEKTKLMQLCNPHNPNGKVFSREELLAVADFCLRRNLILCSDEVHADLILDDKKHLCIASLDDDIAQRTITLQSPSKAFNVAGLNFAVAVIPNPRLRKKFQHAAEGKVLTDLNPFGMTATVAAWNGDSDQWLADAIAFLKKNRDALSVAVAKINGIKMPHLAATYLAWLNVADLHLQNPPQHFEKKGIGLSPGEDFGDKDYMRLNFACDPDVLRQIIRRLS